MLFWICWEFLAILVALRPMVRRLRLRLQEIIRLLYVDRQKAEDKRQLNLSDVQEPFKQFLMA